MFGTETLKFVKDLGHCLKLASGESSAYPFLLQRLSVAIQWRNAHLLWVLWAQSRWRTFLCNLCLSVISCIMLLYNNNNKEV